MCGRVTLTKSGEEVAEAFGLDEAPEIQPRYNIAPSQPVLVVRPSSPSRTAAFLNWGLRTQPDDKPLINARAETVATRGAFKSAFAARRCLVPADGFYEWQGPKGTKFRQAYHLRLAGMGLFGLAGIWEPGLGEAPGTLAILTTAPNEVLAPIHDRMPLILQPADYTAWLDPHTEAPTLRALFAPFPAAAMQAIAVGEAVNSAGRDDPSCLRPPTAVQGRLI
jgi:putative SOS response-associated peptidase YedK